MNLANLRNTVLTLAMLAFIASMWNGQMLLGVFWLGIGVAAARFVNAVPPPPRRHTLLYGLGTVMIVVIAANIWSRLSGASG